eukprot:gnl/TRDRNA2_/TRDRNA2_174166_c0_seq1.p1 gnl/TRDRNA2_/TRDRNA2_174166_c0~~gnl/TRDRNA2_/TRDRNA2_174166_c0_seq1.p1  ORF type:complete len:407 (-),score=64.00 gnl/TRDRNA2_/TRDRNA2_174166_c0_seq1:36-1256(-)
MAGREIASLRWDAAKAARTPPPFPQRPPRPPRPPSRENMTHSAAGAAETPASSSTSAGVAARLPPGFDLPPPPPPVREPPTACRRSMSASPMLDRFEDYDSQPPTPRPSHPLVSFQVPEAGSVRKTPSARGSHSTGPSPRPRRTRSQLIDDAIQREMSGSGMALQQAVEKRRAAGWSVKQRHVQRSDVGHCCYACRQPLRDLSEEVTVWTGAAIYRRFHPACAATFVLRSNNEQSEAAEPTDIVEGYADGWRALRDDGGMGMGRPRRAVEAARQWLLSQDPNAWPSLRGDLFMTVTVVENGQKKAVPGLSAEQLRSLTTRHRLRPSSKLGGADDEGETPACTEKLECAICFTVADPANSVCVSLPCAPQHVFHAECVTPWLKKASLCPTCRKDIRPLIHPARGVSR